MWICLDEVLCVPFVGTLASWTLIITTSPPFASEVESQGVLIGDNLHAAVWKKPGGVLVCMKKSSCPRGI
jgi:hypothetical protein